ncbi:MAG: sulfur carrier protein ThiS [Solirubrobacteraceae bacterium]
MKLTVNGEPRELPRGSTVATLVELLGGHAGGRGVAVAVGGEVVPRGRWPTAQLDEGDRVEVLIAVQGG